MKKLLFGLSLVLALSVRAVGIDEQCKEGETFTVVQSPRKSPAGSPRRLNSSPFSPKKGSPRSQSLEPFIVPVDSKIERAEKLAGQIEADEITKAIDGYESVDEIDDGSRSLKKIKLVGDVMDTLSREILVKGQDGVSVDGGSSYAEQDLELFTEQFKVLQALAKKMATQDRSEYYNFPYRESAYFSPKISDVLKAFINHEKKSIKGLWYRFTLYPLAKAMADGIREKNVDTELVINHDHFKQDFGVPLKLVCDAGGKVYIKDKRSNPEDTSYYPPHMHEKSMIFGDNYDGEMAVVGSFNATGQANKNDENITVVKDKKTIGLLKNEYHRVCNLSRLLTSKECISKKDAESSSSSREMNGFPN